MTTPSALSTVASQLFLMRSHPSYPRAIIYLTKQHSGLIISVHERKELPTNTSRSRDLFLRRRYLRRVRCNAALAEWRGLPELQQVGNDFVFVEVSPLVLQGMPEAILR